MSQKDLYEVAYNCYDCVRQCGINLLPYFIQSIEMTVFYTFQWYDISVVYALVGSALRGKITLSLFSVSN